MADVKVEALDPLDESDEEKERLMRELERNLPMLLDAVGCRTFVMFCKQLVDVSNRVQPGAAFYVEKNTHTDGAFLYVGTHSWDVTHAARERLGLTGPQIGEAMEAAAAEVRTKRTKENN